MLARSFSIAPASPMPLIATLAPWLAKARAMARPMPLVEPVTRAFRLASDMATPAKEKRAANCGGATISTLFIALRREWRAARGASRGLTEPGQLGDLVKFPAYVDHRVLEQPRHP